MTAAMPAWPEIADWWWSWTVGVSVQVAVLFAIVWLLDGMLRRWVRPHVLAAIWLVVACKLVLPPTLTSPVSLARIARPDFLPVVGASAAPATADSNVALLLFAVWLTGVIILATWTLGRYRALRAALLPTATVPDDDTLIEMIDHAKNQLGIRHSVEVRVCPGNATPAVIGFWRPVVLLSRGFLDAHADSDVHHALLHELAHIKRRDSLASLVSLSLQLLYWFHPVVWLVRRRQAALREICCDWMVVRTLGGAAPAYRDTLLSLARPMITGDRAGQLGIVHRHGQLLQRLEWLDRSFRPASFASRIATGALCGTLIACCVPLAPQRVRPEPLTPVAALRDPSETAGCLRLRYAVFTAMAAEASAVE